MDKLSEEVLIKYEHTFFEYIKRHFSIKKDGTYSFVIKNSEILYNGAVFVVKFNKQVVASDIVCGEIALLIAECPKEANSLIEVDNLYSKYYNNILFIRNAYEKSTDYLTRATLQDRFLENKIKIKQLVKKVKTRNRLLINYQR
jgi:hypothetical protein